MSKISKYFLISLPNSIVPTNDRKDALKAISSAINDDNGTTYSFPIPDFKIGTLDALVQQADDLAKLDTACEGVVNKVADSLRSILNGDEERISQQKNVNDKPVDQYLRGFSWNKVKFRADRPIADLIDLLQKEITGTDNDVKSKFSQYSQVKTNLTASQRKQTGNLSTKSLASVVPPSVLIQNSEYLETVLVAIPNQSIKEFLQTYETLSPMIVPRSSVEVSSDSEFALYSIVIFKKHVAEFLHRCREKRWTPRDYKFKEGGKEEEAREIDKLSQDERKLWGEALRLGRTGYSESVMIWIHVLALRVFVETVLRYGLPLDFVCALVKSTPKQIKKAKDSLDARYSYLGGNAFGRDSKGRVKKDDSSMSTEMQAAGHSAEGAEYSAYVYYDFQLS